MPYKPSPDLENLIDQLLGSEKDSFFESTGEKLLHTIRFNTLHNSAESLKRFLTEQGFALKEFPGFSDIFQPVVQPFPIGKSLSHFVGHIYVQDLASMMPPRILDPQPGEVVLDMSAAPGSKTTQMAVMMQNRGVIIANDVVQKRLRALVNNLQRFGIVNTAVLKNYGESFGNQYFETFDKILLDPACSGLGTLHKSPEVLSWWTLAHCTRLASGQRAQIASAAKALKPGGVLVYSTCTLTPEENEAVIHQTLSEFPLEIEEIHLPQLKTRPGLTEFEGQTFDRSLQRALRIYPHENETEGFFIARLRKTAGFAARTPRKERKTVLLQYISDSKSPVKKYLDYFSQHFEMDRQLFGNFKYYIDKNITAVSRELAEFEFKSKPVKTGLIIGRPMTHAGKLTTEGVQLLGRFAKNNVIELPDLLLLEKFVNRTNLDMDVMRKSQQIVCYKEIEIGYGLADDGKLKSQFPKTEWPFSLTGNK